MNANETSATVENRGEARVASVPFAPGAGVEGSICPKRRSAAEFSAAWQRGCAERCGRPEVSDITDEAGREEIDRYRAGQ